MAYETALVLGSSFAAFVLAYLGTKVRGDEHFALQTLFIFASVITLITSAGLMREVATASTLSANFIGVLDQHLVMITYCFYIAIAYYVVYYIWKVLTWFRTTTTKR